LEQGTPPQQPVPVVVTPRIHPVAASTQRTTNSSTVSIIYSTKDSSHML